MKKMKITELNSQDEAYQTAKFCVVLSNEECALCENENELKNALAQHIATQPKNSAHIFAKDTDGRFKNDKSVTYFDTHKGLAQTVDFRNGFSEQQNLYNMRLMMKKEGDTQADEYNRPIIFCKEAYQTGKALEVVVDALAPIKKCIDKQPVEHWQEKYDKLTEKMNSRNLSSADTAEMKKAEAMINLANDFNAVMNLDKAKFEKQIQDDGHRILIARGQSLDPPPQILENYQHAQKMLNLIEKIENGSCTKNDVKEAFKDRIADAQQASKAAHSHNLSAKFGHGSDVAKAMQDGLDRLSDKNQQATISQEVPRPGR